MGSKNRYAKYILPIILKNRQPNQYFVDLFCGGANIVDKVDGNRIANDINYYLIQTFIAGKNGWIPPEIITEEDYKNIKNNKDNFPSELVGYVGFSMSFGGKWFGGYRRDKAGDFSLENMRKQSIRSKNSFINQINNLKDVIFYNKNYWEVEIPENSILYLDPPYFSTTGYGNKFNHEQFWQWSEEMVNKGHKVFVSEYHSPESPWIEIWAKKVFSSLTKNTSSKVAVEKLFTVI